MTTPTVLTMNGYYLLAQMGLTPKAIEIGPFKITSSRSVVMDIGAVNANRTEEEKTTLMVFTDVPLMEAWMVSNGFTPTEYPIL